jgi:hypothetical protein
LVSCKRLIPKHPLANSYNYDLPQQHEFLTSGHDKKKKTY